MNKQIMYLILILALIVLTVLLLSKNKPQTEQTPEATQPTLTNSEPESQKQPPEMAIDQNKTYRAVLQTEAGVITIELFSQETPVTVNNFVSLANSGFYDNTIFHRVIEGFMIQGGDPLGSGMGGPGYQFEDEPITRDYTRGIVAMANSGPNTNGSQFFIMHQDNANLPKDYVIFGQVVEGMETVDKITTAEVSMSQSGEASVPVEPIKIKSIAIIEQ